MPMFHAFINVAVLPTLRAGGQVVTLPKFEPASYIEALDRYKVIIMRILFSENLSHINAPKMYLIHLI